VRLSDPFTFRRGTDAAMIGINLFSVIDLFAVVISAQVLLVFFYRSVRVTKRRVDLVFTAVMLLVWLEGIFVLASDNVVPVGVLADAVPNAARTTLHWYRLMYVAGTLLMATLTHFTLRYTQSDHLPGRRVAWLYVGAAALLPIYFTDSFLQARIAPLRPESGWLCAVPWQPDSGPLAVIFIAMWVAVNVYNHWLLWQRPRSPVNRNIFDQRNFVWAGIGLWGVAGLISTILAAAGYAGVDPTMFLITGAMVVLSVGLAEDHRHSELRSGFIKQVFGRYVTDDVVGKLLDEPAGLELGGETRVVSVLMSDIRGFTTVAERLPPGQVVTMLNIYLGTMAEVITEHHGTVNEFIGDGILAIFGAPIRRDDFVESAVRCALAMQRAMGEVNRQIAVLGVPALEMGIGINTGEVVVGNIGSAKRAKYGVVGSNVNLASRIEAATVGGQVLVSQSTHEALPGLIEVRREHLLHAKGSKQPMRVFEVSGISGDRPLRLPTPEENWSDLREPRVLECTLVTDEKQIVGPPFVARVIAVGQTSVELDTRHGLEVAINLRMRIQRESADETSPDLYGKVVACGPVAGRCGVRFTSLPANAWQPDVRQERKLAELFQR
jgi:class 3 adenylate cyclase